MLWQVKLLKVHEISFWGIDYLSNTVSKIKIGFWLSKWSACRKAKTLHSFVDQGSNQGVQNELYDLI